MSNSVGVIDSGYRGEVKVALDNLSEEPYLLKKGQAIVQVVTSDLNPPDVKVVEALN